MPTKLNPAPFAIVIGITVVLQLALIGVDIQETPVKVAKRFADAYYAIDGDMQDYLCSELAQDGELVGDYLFAKQQEASMHGRRISYLRHQITKAHLQVVDKTDDSATIHLTGTTRVSIHPAFMIIGKLFHLGRDYPMDETLELVKDNGQWRVCGNPFGLSPQG
jgi:hypothetical protein